MTQFFYIRSKYIKSMIVVTYFTFVMTNLKWQFYAIKTLRYLITIYIKAQQFETGQLVEGKILKFS